MELKSELSFYEKGFEENSSRQKRGYGWPYEPSKNIEKLLLSLSKKFNLGLDIGTGDGRNIPILKRFCKKVVGIDFSKKAINLAKNRFPSTKFERLDMLTKKLKNIGQFDFILDWGVFTHIRKKDTQKYLSKINKLLSPNGIYLVVIWDYLSGPISKNGYFIKKGHYTKAYNLQELKKILKRYISLKLINSRLRVLEDNKKKVYMNYYLFKKLN